jgi:serine/threonine protein phosphatase PrpC
MTQHAWKLLCDSVSGVSHEISGLPCQDYYLAECIPAAAENVLVLVCADGAGSAEHAALGARTAAQMIAREIKEAVEDGLRVSAIDGESLLGWHRHACEMLRAEAELRSATLRDFACTMLTAVVGDQAAAFSQIGDGAIILRDGDGYRTAFWPQSGEYVNTTNFLTDEEFESCIEFLIIQEPLDELALLTDGLQMLCLRYADKAAHDPFFRPMFEALRAANPPSVLQAPLRAFLTSQEVNQRTDDDKTLILATRRLPDDPAQLLRQPESPS